MSLASLSIFSKASLASSTRPAPASAGTHQKEQDREGCVLPDEPVGSTAPAAPSSDASARTASLAPRYSAAAAADAHFARLAALSLIYGRAGRDLKRRLNRRQSSRLLRPARSEEPPR